MNVVEKRLCSRKQTDWRLAVQRRMGLGGRRWATRTLAGRTKGQL